MQDRQRSSERQDGVGAQLRLLLHRLRELDKLPVSPREEAAAFALVGALRAAPADRHRVEQLDLLRSYLRPLLAKSPREGQAFDARFRSVFAQPEGEPPTDPDQATDTQAQPGRRWLWLAAVIFLIGASVLLYTVSRDSRRGPTPSSPGSATLNPAKQADAPQQPASPQTKKKDETDEDTRPAVPFAPKLSDVAESTAAPLYPISWWQFFAALMLPPCLALFWIIVAAQRRRAYIRRAVDDSGGRVLHSLEVKADAAGELTQSRRQLALGARSLHRRLEQPSSDLDVERTALASLNNGGRFTAVFLPRKTTPEYLILVTSAGPDDHHAERMDWVVQQLAREEVPVKRFFLEHNANRAFEDTRSPRLTLKQLFDRYPNHLLITMGTGDGLLNPGTQKPWLWAEDIRLWPLRVLLTPVPSEDWRRREVQLAHLFEAPLFRTTGESIRRMGEWLQGLREADLHFEGSTRTPTWSWQFDPGRWLAFTPDDPQADWLTLRQELVRYLGDVGYKWLCACAVYPSIRWDITLLLGLRLTRSQETHARSRKPLFTEELATRLSLLPWFRRGFMPDWIRRHLITDMQRERRAEIAKLVGELLAGKLGESSGATVISLPIVTPATGTRVAAGRALDDGSRDDAVLLDYLDRQADDVLSVGAPRSLADRLLGREARYRSGRRPVLAASAIATIVAFAFLPKPWHQLPVPLAPQKPSTSTAADPKKPTDLPRVVLDSGGHQSLIRGIAVTPDGASIASAGDKQVRIWDWRAGKTVRTIRGEIGAGPEGAIYASALSPDGRWLAVGGWFTSPGEVGNPIRLYDFATGQLAALVGVHTDVVLSLAFSPDSKRLLSGGGDNRAVIWDVNATRPLAFLTGHTDRVTAVAFSSNGELAVTGSYDLTIRMWAAETGREFAVLTGHKDRVTSLAVTATTIASGDAAGEIHLWDIQTARFLKKLPRSQFVGALAFAPDGQRLLATSAGTAPYAVRVLDIESGRTLISYDKHTNIVLAAAITPDGQHAVTAGGTNNEIHVWDMKSGDNRAVLSGTGMPVFAAGFSKSAELAAWGNKDGGSQSDSAYQQRLRLPATSRSLGRPEAVESPDEYVGSLTNFADISISTRPGGQFGFRNAILDIRRASQTDASIARDSASGYGHHAYTLTPDGASIISGGANGALVFYDMTGRTIGQFVGHESDVWAVSVSPDGRLLASGGADQMLRFWNIRTRELISTLFRGRDGEWVMWVPHGYYTGSPGADKIVGWQINKGPDKTADYVGADQLRSHLNRPDIVEKAMILASAEQAVRESPGTSFKIADLLARPVPNFRIISPNSPASGGRVVLGVAFEATRDPITSIRIQVNGRQVSEEVPKGDLLVGLKDFDIPLAKGQNAIRIIASNAVGDKVETVTIDHDGEGALDRRGTLYVLAIGVDRYPRLGNTCGANGKASCDLRFAGGDARLVADALERRLGPSHQRVVKRVLTNGSNEPTASNILDALDILREANETDTITVFIAGHGVNDGPNYRFLSSDAEKIGDTYRGATVVPWQVIQEAIESARGRRVLFLDTNTSSSAYNQRFGNAAYHANIIAYTAARFDQLAFEDAKLGHGLFAYALAEGLNGGADDSSGNLTTIGLGDYLRLRLRELAKGMRGEQESQFFTGRDAEDFMLAGPAPPGSIKRSVTPPRSGSKK